MEFKRILSGLVILLAILSALVTISSFGYETPESPFAPVELILPSSAESSGDHTAIIDRDARRLLILDENDKLQSIVSFTAFGAPIDAALDVCVSDNDVYVAGVKYEGDSDLITQERVVAYHFSGGEGAIVYEQEGHGSNEPSIKSVSDHGDGVVITHLTAGAILKYRLLFTYADRSGTENLERRPLDTYSVFDADYVDGIDSQGTRDCVTISSRGMLNDQLDWENPDPLRDHIFTTVEYSSTGSVYANDETTGAVCRISEDGTVEEVVQGSGFVSVKANSDTLAMCPRNRSEVWVSGLEGENLHLISSCSLKPTFAVFVALLRSCHAYLIILAIALVFRHLYKIVDERRHAELEALLATVAIVTAVVVIVVSLSYNSYVRLTQTRGQEISAYADYLDRISPNLTDLLEGVSSRADFRSTGEELVEAYNAQIGVEQNVGSLAIAASTNGIGTYTIVYALDPNGIYYLYDSTAEHVIGTAAETTFSSENLMRAFESDEIDITLYEGRTLRDTTLYRLVTIPNADFTGVVGVIEIGSKARSFMASVTKYLYERVVALLVLMIVVYLSYSEIHACGRDLYRSRSVLSRTRHDALALLTRPLSMIVTTLTSMDSVLTVIIARSLVAKTASDLDPGLLVTIPSVTLGIGLALGQACYGFLSNKVRPRRLMCGGAIVLMVCAGFGALSVMWGNLWLYAVAKALIALPLGMMYTLCYSLPHRADNHEYQALASHGIRRTDTSGVALGTVLGSGAAEAFGYGWVYVLLSLCSIALFFAALKLIPAKSGPLENRTRSVTVATWLRFIFSRPTTYVIVFLMLPVFLSNGYSSFLFPLYSSDAGLSSYTISNLFVLGYLVVYACINIIDYLDRRFDKWRVAIASLVLLCVTFLLFSLNTTMVWAITVIPLVALFCKSGDDWKALWARTAQEKGVSLSMAAGTMFAIRSLILVVQPLILTALRSASGSVFAVALGAICGVCALAFWATTRNTCVSPLAKP